MNEPKNYKEYVTLTENGYKVSIDVKTIECDDDYQALLEILKYSDSQVTKPYSYYLSFKEDKWLTISLISFFLISIFNMFMLNSTGSYYYLFFNVINGGLTIYNFYLNNRNKYLNYLIRRNLYLSISIEIKSKLIEYANSFEKIN